MPARWRGPLTQLPRRIFLENEPPLREGGAARSRAERTAIAKRSNRFSPQARPHLTLPCVNSAPARAASCIRIRSAARSNSFLHLSEQKKYRRFLYSLEGVRSLPSTGTPQMGSYDRPFVFAPESEFKVRPPTLPTPEPASCKRNAAFPHTVAGAAVREALP